MPEAAHNVIPQAQEGNAADRDFTPCVVSN
jgi:hypothetical protein